MKENVFYCKDGHSPIALVKKEEKAVCYECNKEMGIIGYMEVNDGGETK